MDSLTIEKTTKNDLCVSCGICKAVCPVDAINMKPQNGQYIPQIDHSKCIDCGKCLKICPGYEVDYTELYENKEWNYPNNIFEGNFINSYITYTKDDKIRKEATSGGVITNLLIKLTKDSLYDKAFVVDFNPGEKSEVKSKAVDSKEDIIKAAKSKYLPVSVEDVCNYIKEHQDDKVIVVGTSCHFHGINKFAIEENLSLGNVLFFGLFCDRTLNLNLLEFFKDNYIGSEDKLYSFDYRNKEDKGWPGNLKIKLEKGKEKYIDRKIRMWLKPYFTLNRCLFCIDKLNQLADISFGDCYIRGEESYLGKSNIIIRSKKGQVVFNKVKDILEYEEVSFDKIVESQHIDKRKDNLKYDRFNGDRDINIVKKLEDYDQEKIKKALKYKKNNIKLGQNYEKNKELINKEIKKKKIKSKLRIPKKAAIKFLNVLGLKNGIKKILGK